MARVWRDGQTRPVLVYRLATAGTLEEKIFQRQVTKQGLGPGIVGAEASEDGDKALSDFDQQEVATSSKKSRKAGGGQFHFSKEELKDLFTFR